VILSQRELLRAKMLRHKKCFMPRCAQPRVMPAMLPLCATDSRSPPPKVIIAFSADKNPPAA
jgi:hypothetical protein